MNHIGTRREASDEQHLSGGSAGVIILSMSSFIKFVVRLKVKEKKTRQVILYRERLDVHCAVYRSRHRRKRNKKEGTR